MKVVGIGTSAGGVEALRAFLSHLSPNTGAAFVIIQHLSPDFDSVMKDLLKRYTDMPVVELHEDQLVEANHIYLMPANKTITYQYGMLKLHQRDKFNQLNLPIDKFFHSLGEGLKKDAIAVILSGSGTDGSRGARTIKEQEGIILVQSPESAEFDGMPKSLIQLDIADAILPPETLAKKLGEVIQQDITDAHEDKNGGLNGDDKRWFDKIIDLTSDASQIDFEAYKTTTLKRRIEKQMLLQQCRDLKTFYQHLKENEETVDILSRDFLISVTRFFRDKAYFDEVADVIIPKICDATKENETCRIWVVACSTGEEAYSIGILFSDYIKKNKRNIDFKIFASDVSRRAIALATKGLYNSSISSDVPKPYLNEYFIQEGEYYQVKPSLQEKIIFVMHNVLSDPPFINMNLISCRNFLIYLQPKMQIKTLKTLYFSLKEDQFLMLGPSESLGELNNVFFSVNRAYNIFQKEEAESYVPSSRFEVPNKKWDRNIPTPIIPLVQRAEESQPYIEKPYEPFSDYILREFAPNILMLSESLDVHFINGNFEHILTLPRAVASLNLEKMLPRDKILIFRDGVRLALNSEQTHLFDDVEFVKKDQVTRANLYFTKVRVSESGEPFVQVRFDFKDVEKSKRKVKKEEFGEASYNKERILRLEKELEEKTNEIRELQSEIDLTKIELSASNQELLSRNEELQSTNEELQSLNEELHTVNSELENKNKQLAASNDDMDNFLKSTEIGTIFLDKDLSIRKFTPAITRQFDLIPSDISRSISVFVSKINMDTQTLIDCCKKVMETQEKFEREITDQEGKTYLLRILPYYSEANKVDGIVMSLIDLNEKTLIKKELERLGRKFKTIMNSTKVTALFLSVDGEIQEMNHDLGPLKKSKLIGAPIFSVFPEAHRERLRESFREMKRTGEEQVTDLFLTTDNDAPQYSFRLIPIFDSVNTDQMISVFAAAINVNEMISYMDGD